MQTTPDADKRSTWGGFVWPVVLLVLVVSLAPFAPAIWRGVAHAEFRTGGPNWVLWLRQPLTIQLHVYAALTALGIGTVLLLKRKGTRFHKTLGWAWVAAMGLAAGSSLFITGLNGDFYSYIHLLSGWTLIALPMGIYAIRNKRVRAHRSAMTGIFVGGLLIAGAFAFIPGRLMWSVFFG